MSRKDNDDIKSVKQQLTFLNKRIAELAKLSPEGLAERLSSFDAVSFDIFDTLIRPFAAPTDLFHIVGVEAGFLNFAEIRDQFKPMRFARSRILSFSKYKL